MSASNRRPFRWRILLTGLLTSLFACFLIAPMVLLLRAHGLHEQIAEYLTVEHGGMLYRTQIELDAVATTLYRLRAGDPEASLGQLRLGYDLLFGRNESVSNVADQTLLGPLPSFATTVDALADAIAAADAALTPTPDTASLPEVAAELLDGLQPAQVAVATLIRDFRGASAAERDTLRRQAESLNGSVYSAMWALMVASPIYIGGLILVNFRLSRARRRLAALTEQLRCSNSQLTALLKHVPARISIKDTAGRYLMVNSPTVEFHGRPEAELLGRHRYEIDPTPNATMIHELEQEVLRCGAPVSRQYELRIDDRIEWHLAIKFPIRDDDGAVFGIGGFSLDITREKAIEHELIRAKDSAEAAGRAKTDFLANMSHELRTPLNAVIGFSEIMADQLFGPLGNARYREYASDIRRSARHLLGVIGQILDFTRIEGGHWQLDRQPMAPAEVGDEAGRMLRPMAESRGIELRIESGDAPASIRADRQAVLQVLLNLLGNAIKFSPSGSPVTGVLSTAADGGLVITVRDRGPGIAAADLARLATPFTRLTEAYAQASEGIGLGLSITKALVELHGGSLNLASTPGEGTVVTAVVPPAPVGQQALRAA